MSEHVQTVSAVFPTYEAAAGAVRALEAAGYDHSHIAIVTHKNSASTLSPQDETLVVEGAKEGILVGAGAAILTAAAVAIFPGTLFLVGGWLAGAEIATFFGMAGGLGAALAHYGYGDDQAKSYATAVEAGNSLVTVRCSDIQVPQVKAILGTTATSTAI
jgi:ABC-type sugar transport system substrate-binding protein